MDNNSVVIILLMININFVLIGFLLGFNHGVKKWKKLMDTWNEVMKETVEAFNAHKGSGPTKSELEDYIHHPDKFIFRG